MAKHRDESLCTPVTPGLSPSFLAKLLTQGYPNWNRSRPKTGEWHGVAPPSTPGSGRDGY